MSFDDLIDDCVICGEKGILIDIINDKKIFVNGETISLDGQRIFMCHKCYLAFNDWLEKAMKRKYGKSCKYYYLQDEEFQELLVEYLQKKAKKFFKKHFKVKLILT